MKSARILLSLAVMAVAMVFTTGSASAAQLRNAQDSLSNPVGGASSTHTFQFSTATADDIGTVLFLFCDEPSGAGGSCDPTGAGLTSSTVGSITGLAGTWLIENDSVSNGFYVTEDSNAVAKNGDEPISIQIAAITNSPLGTNCDDDADGSSDTCYIRISTYDAITPLAQAAPAGNLVDETIISYTVVAAVTVSARVDPTFTFVVTGVNTGVGTNGLTTSVSSAYNTLPFGNLTAGAPKYAAHKLYVTTNTQGGYTVTAQMQQQMTGVYANNNIDPYAATNATWATPIGWTEPTGGTPSQDTGWIGANTNDTDVSGWSGSTLGLFGPVSGTANVVSKKTSADNGTVPAIVTYAIEANVFQPADTYSGTLVYNALPTY